MRRATCVCSVEGKPWSNPQGGGQRKVHTCVRRVRASRAGRGHGECAAEREAASGQRTAHSRRDSFHAKPGRKVGIHLPSGYQILHIITAFSARTFLLDGMILDGLLSSK